MEKGRRNGRSRHSKGGHGKNHKRTRSDRTFESTEDSSVDQEKDGQWRKQSSNQTCGSSSRRSLSCDSRRSARERRSANSFHQQGEESEWVREKDGREGTPPKNSDLASYLDRNKESGKANCSSCEEATLNGTLRKGYSSFRSKESVNSRGSNIRSDESRRDDELIPSCEESVRMARSVLSIYNDSETMIYDEVVRCEMKSKMADILLQLQTQQREMELRLKKAERDAGILRVERAVNKRCITGLEMEAKTRVNSSSVSGSDDQRTFEEDREKMLQMIKDLEGARSDMEERLKDAKQETEKLREERLTSLQRVVQVEGEREVLKEKLVQIERTREDLEIQLTEAVTEARQLKVETEINSEKIAQLRSKDDSESLRRLESERKNLHLEIRKNLQEREEVTLMIEELESSHDRVQNLLETRSVKDKSPQKPIRRSMSGHKSKSFGDFDRTLVNKHRDVDEGRRASLFDFGHNSVPAFEAKGNPIVSRSARIQRSTSIRSDSVRNHGPAKTDSFHRSSCHKRECSFDGNTMGRPTIPAKDFNRPSGHKRGWSFDGNNLGISSTFL